MSDIQEVYLNESELKHLKEKGHINLSLKLDTGQTITLLLKYDRSQEPNDRE